MQNVNLPLFLLFRPVVASSKEFHERNTATHSEEFFGIKGVSPVPLSLEIFSGRNVLFINT